MRAAVYVLTSVWIAVAACTRPDPSTAPGSNASTPEPDPPLDLAAEPEPEPESPPVDELPACTPVSDEIVTLLGVIEGPLFRLPSSKGELLPTAMPRLDAIAEVLQRHPAVVLEIRAHTDAKTAEEFRDRARRPTERQAAVVRDYLVSRGARGEQLSAKGYGEEVPIANNDSAEGRALNRRVELVLLPREGDCPLAAGE